MSDKIIQLNEDLIKHDLKDLVRNSVEETLNALLDKEADELINAEKYERSADRQGYRSGHYKRNLHTTAGETSFIYHYNFILGNLPFWFIAFRSFCNLIQLHFALLSTNSIMHISHLYYFII